jgi:hypothetical protein
MLSFLAALISGIVLPITFLLLKKFKVFDEQFMLIRKSIDKVQERSDRGDLVQNSH